MVIIFKIPDIKFNQIEKMKIYAFALAIDKEIIYTGYVWPPISEPYNWIRIEPYTELNELIVMLPLGFSFPENKSDPRNEQRIIDLLKKDGKLK